MFSVYMFTPTTSGGHARYTHELLTAMAAELPEPGAVNLVTTPALDPAFDTDAFTIHRILPPQPPARTYRSLLEKAFHRIRYYRNRDSRFLSFIRSRPGTRVVHFQEGTFWSEFWDIWRLKRAGAVVFYTVHNIRWNSYPWRGTKKLIDWLQDVAYRNCDGLIVHSEELKQNLSSVLGPRRPPIFVAHHGTWSGSEHNSRTIDVDQQLAKQHIVLFGRVGYYKGVHVLVEAMKYLPEHITLTIAGKPLTEEYNQQLKSAIAQLEPGRVELLDRFLAEDELPGVFERGTILALPYVNFNAQSGVLHDAIAWQLPVAGTEVGAIGNTIREWDMGNVVAPDDARALAESILDLLKPDRYKQAMHGIARAREELSWQKSAQATLQAYRSVLASRSPDNSTR